MDPQKPTEAFGWTPEYLKEVADITRELHYQVMRSEGTFDKVEIVDYLKKRENLTEEARIICAMALQQALDRQEYSVKLSVVVDKFLER